ncbi:MAG: hypothetical protein ACPHDT_15280, partial [Acidimicrobiales bacterium]
MAAVEPTSLTGVERLNYERSTVEPFTSSFGWRTLFNVMWPLAGWIATVTAVLSDRLPMLVGVIVAAAMLQAFYMPVHESVHRTISAGRNRWVWIDRAVGSFGA